MKISLKLIALIISALIILTSCDISNQGLSSSITTSSESDKIESNEKESSIEEISSGKESDSTIDQTESDTCSIESELTDAETISKDTDSQPTDTQKENDNNDTENTESTDGGIDNIESYCPITGESHVDVDDDGTCDNCAFSVIVIIDFYVINDLHGKFADTDSNGGVDELTTYLRNAGITDDNVVLLSSGDMWQGSSESNLTKGLIITDWMNDLDFVSMTIGNHEYDWGSELIELNADAAEFPFLAINIYDRQTNERVEYCQPSVVVERDGIQIGIIGAVGDCYSSIASDKCEDVYFKVGDQLTALVKAEADRLRAEGVDYIVYSIHDGYGKSSYSNGSITASNLSSYYDVSLSNGYVDLVFEGHTHQRYVLQDQYGVYHLQNGGDNKGISHVEITVNLANDNSKVNHAEYVASSTYSSLSDDPIVDDLLEKYADVIAKANEVLGTNKKLRKSSEIMQIVAQLYYEKGLELWGDKYDIVLGGGFLKARSPYEVGAGEVKYSDLQSVLPFDNQLVLCSIKGKYLKSKFFETTNSDYYIAYGDYGSSVKNNIDANATYYVIVDSYTSSYAPNNLTVVETLNEETFARDLLAEYIKNGGWS